MKIVSNHCVGAELDRHLDREFSSPFAWAIILPSDFFKLIQDLEGYLSTVPVIIYDKNASEIKDGNNAALRLEKSSIAEYRNYPTVKLNDVYVHFIHNNSEKNSNVEAKFCKRVQRFLQKKDETLFLFAQSKYSTPADVTLFESLELTHKISMSTEEVKAWDLNRAKAYIRSKSS